MRAMLAAIGIALSKPSALLARCVARTTASAVYKRRSTLAKAKVPDFILIPQLRPQAKFGAVRRTG